MSCCCAPLLKCTPKYKRRFCTLAPVASDLETRDGERQGKYDVARVIPTARGPIFSIWCLIQQYTAI